jgi:hypothetical protein
LLAKKKKRKSINIEKEAPCRDNSKREEMELFP